MKMKAILELVFLSNSYVYVGKPLYSW